MMLTFISLHWTISDVDAISLYSYVGYVDDQSCIFERAFVKQIVDLDRVKSYALSYIFSIFRASVNVTVTIDVQRIKNIQHHSISYKIYIIKVKVCVPLNCVSPQGKIDERTTCKMAS